MTAIGYQPGAPKLSDVAAKWTSGIVRISSSFETRTGQTLPRAEGTGFIIEAWPGLVLTARHIVVRPDAVEASRMRVEVAAPVGDRFDRADALAISYPEDPALDVAVVLIAGVAGSRLKLAEPFPDEGASFFGTAQGYARGGLHPIALESRLTRIGGLLWQLDQPAIEGMSGGPVCTVAGGALGIQSRNAEGRAVATVIEFSALNECALQARSLYT